MYIISNANDTVINMLSNMYKPAKEYKLSQYCVQSEISDGILLFNILTRELILLSQEEYSTLMDLDYLRERFFLVPNSINEKEYADVIKAYLYARNKKPKSIKSYTIFTTTDCNARCFYCFELGRSRIPMSIDVAKKLLQFIKDHCGNNRVKLSWFGGEPLMNPDVIDLICEGLRSSGIDYVSRMTSNGYLFNDNLIQKAAGLWNLKRVQITLDGTETIYNKTKAYIYKDGNPYHIVMDNISKLLDASISVSVRLNMDLHNADDLLLLAQELSSRFNNSERLHVYAHHIFKSGVPMAQMHSDEEWDLREKAMSSIEHTLESAGLASVTGISKKFKTTHCMADCGSAITVLPDGNIGLCEHHTENEFIGHLDRKGFDRSVIESWREKISEIPECIDCFYFPQCIKLKKCTNASECYPQFRRNTYRAVQHQMRNEYYRWKTRTTICEDSFFEDDE